MLRRFPQKHKPHLARPWRGFQYGLTKKDFYELLADQDWKCAICREAVDEQSAVIDHDHRTKKVRGLLCNLCNVGLGCFKDKIKSLVAAVEYLSR